MDRSSFVPKSAPYQQVNYFFMYRRYMDGGVISCCAQEGAQFSFLAKSGWRSTCQSIQSCQDFKSVPIALFFSQGLQWINHLQAGQAVCYTCHRTKHHSFLEVKLWYVVVWPCLTSPATTVWQQTPRQNAQSQKSCFNLWLTSWVPDQGILQIALSAASSTRCGHHFQLELTCKTHLFVCMLAVVVCDGLAIFADCRANFFSQAHSWSAWGWCVTCTAFVWLVNFRRKRHSVRRVHIYIYMYTF